MKAYTKRKRPLLDSTDVRVDPVCGMHVDAATADTLEYNGTAFHFCTTLCMVMFENDPEKYITAEPTSMKSVLDRFSAHNSEPR